MNTSMTYLGIACATDFIKVSFSAWEIVLTQIKIRRSSKCLNFTLCILPSGVGRPRYLTSNSSCTTFSFKGKKVRPHESSHKFQFSNCHTIYTYRWQGKMIDLHVSC